MISSEDVNRFFEHKKSKKLPEPDNFSSCARKPVLTPVLSQILRLSLASSASPSLRSTRMQHYQDKWQQAGANNSAEYAVILELHPAPPREQVDQSSYSSSLWTQRTTPLQSHLRNSWNLQMTSLLFWSIAAVRWPTFLRTWDGPHTRLMFCSEGKDLTFCKNLISTTCHGRCCLFSILSLFSLCFICPSLCGLACEFMSVVWLIQKTGQLQTTTNN